MEKEKKVKTKKVNTKKEKKKKVSLFTVLFSTLIVVAVVLLCIGINCLVQSIRYKYYTEQMNLYRYNELYTNKKATAFSKVTNIEMYRVLLGGLNDTLTVDKVALVNQTKDMTEDDVWFETARLMNLRLRVEDKARNKRATSIDAVITAMRIAEGCLGIEIEEAKLNMSEKKLSKFTTSDAKYIAKAVTLGLIENNNSALSNKKIIKGELNKLVIEVASKYATVYYKDNYINEEGKLVKNDVQIVTDKEELPTNYEDYPYVVNNIDKFVYELPSKVEYKSDYQSPKEVFKEMGRLYGQIDNTITGYYDALLNIDHTTIDAKSFADRVSAKSLYTVTTDDVDSYVEYVKKNKITIKGETAVLLPIIYYSGDRYYVRAKLTFEIVSSNTKSNLIYGDLGNDVKYEANKYVVYVDVPMSPALSSKTIYVEGHCIGNKLVVNDANIIVPKMEGGVIYEKTK